MAVPLAAIPFGIKAISSLAGGIGGYQRGGLKGALVGGGLGFAAPGAVRMAGTALGGKLGVGALGKMGAGLDKAGSAIYGMGPSVPGWLGGPAATAWAGKGLGTLCAGVGGAGGAAALGTALGTGYGALGAPGTGMLTSAVTGGAGNVLGSGAKALQGQGNLVPLSALPPGYQPNTNSMVRGPEGNWWYQMDPGGVAEGNRVGRMRDAQTDASNINTIGNALFGQTERVARAEFERQAAAKQLAANVEQAKAMALNSQAAGLQVGMDAGRGMADAMSNRSNFRYL